MAKSKLPNFLKKMNEVLEDPRTVILTDKELLTAVNRKLPKADKVSLSCFEFWKSPTLNRRSPENQNLDEELVEEFRESLAYARVHQKMELTGNLLDPNNKGQWGSKTLLEWKFKDLQIHKNIEVNHNKMIQITASSNEHKQMIDSILNAENYLDVDFEEVEQEQLLITKDEDYVEGE